MRDENFLDRVGNRLSFLRKLSQHAKEVFWISTRTFVSCLLASPRKRFRKIFYKKFTTRVTRNYAALRMQHLASTRNFLKQPAMRWVIHDMRRGAHVSPLVQRERTEKTKKETDVLRNKGGSLDEARRGA